MDDQRGLQTKITIVDEWITNEYVEEWAERDKEKYKNKIKETSIRKLLSKLDDDQIVNIALGFVAMIVLSFFVILFIAAMFVLLKLFTSM